MRVLAVVIASLLLLGSLYFAECQDTHKRRDSDGRPPPCSQFCDSPSDCGPPCPNCDNNWWRSSKCK
uniref:Putative secreted peptide of 4.99 kDa n=1 Tax=Ixodes ricinus TaxID=34613 RepID=V5GVS4_IXORI